jgi:hypothetical protein
MGCIQTAILSLVHGHHAGIFFCRHYVQSQVLQSLFQLNLERPPSNCDGITSSCVVLQIIIITNSRCMVSAWNLPGVCTCVVEMAVMGMGMARAAERKRVTHPHTHTHRYQHMLVVIYCVVTVVDWPACNVNNKQERRKATTRSKSHFGTRALVNPPYGSLWTTRLLCCSSVCCILGVLEQFFIVNV